MKIFNKLVNTNAALVLLDQAIYSGTNFIITLFLAKQMNIADFGIFSTVVVFTYLALSLINAILVQPFQVSIATVANKKEYFVFLFMGVLIMLFVFNFLAMPFTLLIKTKCINIPYVIFFISMYLFQDFLRKLFLAIGEIQRVVLIDILFLILTAFGFWVLFLKINSETAFMVIGFANLLSSFIGIQYFVKNFQIPSDWKIYLIDHIHQGKWLLSVAVLQWASSNFFVLISGIYIGIEALGALRLVQSFFGILNIVLQTVENYFLPKIASLYHENSLKAKKYLFEITAYGTLFFGFILLVLFVFASKIIVLVGGNLYEKYAFVVRIMTVLYFFIFLSYPVRIMIRVMQLNKTFFYGYFFSFLASIVSFHLLFSYFGLSGAVMGLILNQIIMLIYWQNQLKKNHFLLWR